MGNCFSATLFLADGTKEVWTKEIMVDNCNIDSQKVASHPSNNQEQRRLYNILATGLFSLKCIEKRT